MNTCPLCQGSMWRQSTHTCPPLWHVWNPENGEREDYKSIRAANAEEAVRHWAQLEDSNGDYLICGGHGHEEFVLVARECEEEAVRYRVWGEMVPEYHAEKA